MGTGSVEKHVSTVKAPIGRPRRPRRWRRGVVVAGVLVVVAGTGGGLAATGVVGGGKLFGANPAKTPSPDSSAATSTALVTQQTLSERTSVNGTLGYSGSYDVIDQASGTITGMPPVGKVISQGHVLYQVSGSPVVLLQGSKVPAYRALSVTMSGPDVRQLNADLVALGYASSDELDPHSGYFSWATVTALEKLQKAVGQTQTGQLGLGQAVFLAPRTIRITKVTGVYGGPAQPGAPVIEATSTTRYVTVALDATLQSLVKAGDQVIVTLPDHRTTPGRISSVGSVAVATPSGSTVEVDVSLSDPGATGQLDQAPVTVSIVSQSVANVLAVPVNALLARPGGYAVEVAGAGNARRLVGVTPGLFDDDAGLVQVTGPGLAAGQHVVIPAS
jgi:Putative peptidoglycan binding domain